MIKIMHENDYSETDEFTLIKEMNHWIKDLKKFFVDDKKAQKAIADYFYYDDGKHQEDFKELQSSVKTLHKLWLKLDNIVEEAEEREYKEKNKKESYKRLSEGRHTDPEIVARNYYNSWSNGFISSEEIKSELKKHNWSDYEIDLVFSYLSEWYEDDERKEYENESLNLKEEDTEIEVENPGLLEVPEGKNVDDLPLSHFVKLANKKGLGKIVKGLNNLQVWNKNKDPKLSKWAGDMIDKLNKKLKKEESYMIRIKESNSNKKDLINDMEEIGLKYNGIGRTGNIVFYDLNADPTDVKHLYVKFNSWDEVEDYLNSYDEDGFMDECNLTEATRDEIDRLICDMEVIGFEYDGTDNRGRLLFNSWDGNSTQAFPDWEEVRNYLENGSEPFEF